MTILWNLVGNIKFIIEYSQESEQRCVININKTKIPNITTQHFILGTIFY